MKIMSRLLLVLLFSVFFTHNAFTQTSYTWNGGSGDWNVAGNWTPAGVPGSADIVLITASGTYTVTLDVDTIIADISIGGTSGIQTLSLTGRTFTINGTAMIGDSGTVSLTNSTINGLGLLTNTGTLAVTSSTLDLDFDNAGFVSFTHACSINNALTTQPNSTIRLSSAYVSAAYLTVANGFTNNGLIEFITTQYNYIGTLDITSGTLVNAPGGTIHTTATGAYASNIYAPLDNQGTITLDNSLVINKASAALTNSGTLSLNSGTLTLTQSGTAPSFTNTGVLTVDSATTVVLSSGSFDYSSGSFNLNGTLSASNAAVNFTPSFINTANINLTNSTLTCASDFTNQGDLTLTGSTINGIATLTNEDTMTVTQSTLDLDFDNAGFVSFTHACSINNALTTQPNSTIRLSSAYVSAAYLTVANGFTNNGLIEFITTQYNYIGTLDITSGTLVNAPGGTIHTTATGAYASNIYAPLDNQGTITLDNSLVINKASAALTNSGTLSLNSGTLTLTQSGTAPSFTNTGVLTVDSATTVVLSSGSFDYSSGSFNLNGTLSASNAAVNFTPSFINTANINLTNSTLTCASDFTNQGDLTLTGSTINGIATLTNEDTMTVTQSTLDLDFDNAGFVSFTHACSINNALTTQPNSTIWLSSAYVSAAYLTVANGFTNNGLIEFITTQYNYIGTLDITSGTLVNAPGGTIHTTATGAYASNIYAPLDNQGTITLDNSLVINKASAALTNSGTLSLNSGTLTLTQSGTAPSFTNTGVLTVDSATTVVLSSGSFDYSSGSFNLNGTLSASNAAVNFTPSFINTANINLTNSTLTCASDFTNQGDLTLTGSTINGIATLTNEDTMTVTQSTLDLDFDNAGFVSFTHACSINNALTTQPNSTIWLSSAYVSAAYLTVANGFTNNGLIEFITTQYNYIGTLDITSGTLVNAPGGTIHTTATGAYASNIYAPLDNQGSIICNAALVINKTNETHYNSGEIQLNNATISFYGNQFENTMAGAIGGNGTFNVTNLPFVNNGSFMPGNFPGILNIADDLPSAATASLNFNLGGPIIGEFYNSLAVAQTANYNGTININLIDGYMPNNGQIFILATCNSHNGSFLVQNGLSINAWKEFELVYEANELKLITKAITGLTSPYANDDFATANDDVEILVDVLYNDTDPNGEDLTLISAGPAKNGVTQVGQDNMVSYTPDSSFTGQDKFIYTIENVSGSQTSGLVTVTVNPSIPQTPQLASPADSSVNVPLDVMLRWYYSTEIDSYQVEISEVPTFNSGNEILYTEIVDTFVNANLSTENTFYWRVLSQNAAGTSAWSVTWSFTTSISVAIEDEIFALPKLFALQQNYPNPFNPNTTIEFDLPKTSQISLKIYNILGEEVTTLVSDRLDAGTYKYRWGASDLASGVYIYRLEAGEYTKTKRMLLMK